MSDLGSHPRGLSVAPHLDPADQRPRLPRVYIARSRLWERLDEATRQPFTLLVGPMGSGKSLGVSGWLDDRRVEDALWLQGDPTCGPETLLEALLPPTAALGRTHATARRQGPRLVVIDDAHLLPAASIRLLDHRLGTAPEDMRVLLISRWDLPITRLGPELLGHFTVLRGDLLRLDDKDSATLVAAHARTASRDVARVVAERTQGWCGAVVLTARAIAATADPLEAAQRFHATDTVVADAVASEVFASLSPRVRHLLLCVANEQVVSVDTATHLTHDSRCGALLADLETTGMLVTRVGDEQADSPPGPAEGRASVPGGTARYRIHPLLAEVTRRRIAAGGVDVERARATVLRAVRIDVAHGDRIEAFRRLVAINHPEAAADLLAAEGHELLMHGGGAAVQAFVRRHPAAVEGNPHVWFAVAMERWFADDIPHALHWMDMHLREAPRDRDRYAGEIACLRLMRARVGLESFPAAVDEALDVLHERTGRVSTTVLPRLLGELGVVQTWLGDLDAAEANLTEAIRLAHTGALPSYAASAMTHLALTYYCQGRERAGAEVAAEALEVISGLRGWRPVFATPRARLTLQLAEMADLPWPDEPGQLSAEGGPLHSADLTAKFWAHLRDARLALMAGSVVTCERILETPADVPSLPRHLRIALLVERAFLAALAGDERGLTVLVGKLDEVAAPAEQTLLRGLLADLRGDRRAAVQLFAAAAAGAPVAQPACRALALVCEAQLRGQLGDGERALAALRAAVTITEVRGNAVPFLGWSRQGSSVHRLLEQLGNRSADGWLQDLTAATAGRPSITAVLGPWTPSVHEREAAADPVLSPALSPRERDVLHELARGSTYADMAANLYVSENTIKTHVSSLYGKLSVRRRSEALAVARNLDLL